MAVLRALASSVRERAAPLAAHSSNDSLVQLLMKAATGKYIDHTNALTFSAVYRGVSLLSSTSASFPRHVYVEGEHKPVKMPEDEYIWGRANPEQLPIVTWETAFGHGVMYGNAYMYIPKGEKIELWPVEPWRVKPVRVGKKKLYEIRLSGGGEVVLGDISEAENLNRRTSDLIMHIPAFGYDGMMGIGLVQMAKTSLGIALAAEEYAAKYFPNSAIPTGGYLTTDQALTPAQAEELSVLWEKYHQGTENAHRTGVMGNGTEFKTTMINPEDLQLLETRKFQVREVATWLGIPPHLLGDVERSTSWGTGLEEQVKGLLTFTLDEKIERFQQAINLNLLRDSGRYMKFERGALMRANLLQRYQAHEIAIRAGFMSPNEVRELEDMEVKAGLDEFFKPVNGANGQDGGIKPANA